MQHREADPGDDRSAAGQRVEDVGEEPRAGRRAQHDRGAGGCAGVRRGGRHRTGTLPGRVRGPAGPGVVGCGLGGLVRRQLGHRVDVQRTGGSVVVVPQRLHGHEEAPQAAEPPPLEHAAGRHERHTNPQPQPLLVAGPLRLAPGGLLDEEHREALGRRRAGECCERVPVERGARQYAGPRRQQDLDHPRGRVDVPVQLDTDG